MDDGSSTPPQLPPSETQSRGMGGSSTSTPPQLPPSEAESRRSMSGSSTNTPPHLIPSNSINQQAEPYTWTTATKVRKEDGTIQLPPNFDLQEKAVKSPPASKFPVTSISIGPTWRRESRREDDLTLKLYLTMKKLVWEFVEGKIEVSWSDITAIQAHAPDDDKPAGVLRIQLGKKPLFYRKSPPQPMRFTGWEPTSDFTVGDHALYHRIHEAEFAHRGVLHELHSTLLRSDPRLLELSMNPFPASSSSAAGLPSTTFTAVGVGERSSHMQMQGESSRNAGHQYNQPLPEENIAAHEAPPINSLSTLEGSNMDASC